MNKKVKGKKVTTDFQPGFDLCCGPVIDVLKTNEKGLNKINSADLSSTFCIWTSEMSEVIVTTVSIRGEMTFNQINSDSSLMWFLDLYI